MFRYEIRESKEQAIARFLVGLKRELPKAIRLQPLEF